jgi:SLOG cluster2
MSIARPLAGCIVGISISESEDMERLGFDRSELNRCVVRLSESLLAAGARIAFGHDWRPGGVMEAVAALAVRYVNVHRDAEGQPARGDAPILNRVAPPDVPFLWQQREEGAAGDSPPNPMARLLDGIVDARQSSAPRGANRAEALSLMREQLADLCHMRVCLGGKLSGFSGKIPGIIEEALGTLRENRPVFSSAIFGGASAVIVRALSGEPAELYPHESAELRARAAHLPRALGENEESRLWHATSVEQCLELILRGAVKWWAQAQPR